MAGGGFQSDDEVFSGINVTPLVDVVLVLLIIFMITAPVLYQSAIKVQLPKASSGESSQSPKALRFTLTREGALAWDDKPIQIDELKARLAKEAAGRDTTQPVLISADQGTAHGKVIELMDVLRQAGLTRFALNVDGGK